MKPCNAKEQSDKCNRDDKPNFEPLECVLFHQGGDGVSVPPCTPHSPARVPSCNLLVLFSDRPWTSVRMGFLFLLVATSLAGVHGFGLGPSLEWKAGDAEMWDQVDTSPQNQIFLFNPEN